MERAAALPLTENFVEGMPFSLTHPYMVLSPLRYLSHTKALRAHSEVMSAALVLPALWVCGGCTVLQLVIYNKGNSRLGFLRELSKITMELSPTSNSPDLSQIFSEFAFSTSFQNIGERGEKYHSRDCRK